MWWIIQVIKSYRCKCIGTFCASRSGLSPSMMIKEDSPPNVSIMISMTSISCDKQFTVTPVRNIKAIISNISIVCRHAVWSDSAHLMITISVTLWKGKERSHSSFVPPYSVSCGCCETRIPNYINHESPENHGCMENLTNTCIPYL